MELIDKQTAIDAIKKEYTICFDKDESGLELALKLIKALPSAQPEMTDEQFEEYCRKRCLSVVTNEFMEDVRKMVPPVWVDMPSAQPKHGKWIERESGIEDKESGFETVIACSCCDFPATTFYSEDCESRTQIRTDFCPNCGADMRGEADDEVGS